MVSSPEVRPLLLTTAAGDGGDKDEIAYFSVCWKKLYRLV